MKIVCPKCGKEIGEVIPSAPLLLQVHCPFDGTDFGLSVFEEAPAKDAPAATESSAPAGS